MRIKHWALLSLVCFLVIGLTACATHRASSHSRAAVVDTHLQDGEDGEVYPEGLGNVGEQQFAESSKCRPGRPIPHAEQHYFFNFDSNEVRPEAMESIQLQANYLLKHPRVRIRLEGHTDDVGSREYNVALGERRARAVLEVLRQYGVSFQQVTVVSYGAEKPAVGGEDEKSRQCNRRVDLIY